MAKEGKPWCKGQLEGIKSNVAALSFAVIGNLLQGIGKTKRLVPELIQIHVNVSPDLMEQSL